MLSITAGWRHIIVWLLPKFHLNQNPSVALTACENRQVHEFSKNAKREKKSIIGFTFILYTVTLLIKIFFICDMMKIHNLELVDRKSTHARDS